MRSLTRISIHPKSFFPLSLWVSGIKCQLKIQKIRLRVCTIRRKLEMLHVAARRGMLTKLPTSLDPSPHKEADLEARLRECPLVALNDTHEASGVVAYTSSSRGDRALWMLKHIKIWLMMAIKTHQWQMIKTSIVEQMVRSMTLDPLLMTFPCNQEGSNTGQDGTREVDQDTSVVSITVTTRMGTTSVAAQGDPFLKEVMHPKSRLEVSEFTPQRISIEEGKDIIARRSVDDALTGSSATIQEDSTLVIISTEAQATVAAIKTFSQIQRIWTRNTHNSSPCLVIRLRALIRLLRWLSAKLVTQRPQIKAGNKYIVRYLRTPTTQTSRNFNTNQTHSSNKEGSTPGMEMTKQALRCLAVASNPYSPRKTHLIITTRILFRCGLRRPRND